MQEKDKNNNINLSEQSGRQGDTSNRISNKRKQPQDEDDLEAEYTEQPVEKYSRKRYVTIITITANN
ncbi:hypothetical protein NF27_IE00040 [Candidatus Jidaibacter acanthamoeba]|uniref:Uncharacterized protein n=1 Tax=Candidatus Jidaibacter acanthamoebae TaxID=86105 RepID=A0A0C1QJL7_9RICK|nr:hypothetical protein [Candidatus Jidaibacter acanthamoeba]KIE04368.1 hypothetical protein NF27_IE00040 [Candidatus Jidaibacter acanthamoeba]